MNTSPFGLQPGSVIQDTYRIDKLLGQGGMGATFRGVNLTTKHEVAIKVMIPSFAANDKAGELFVRESSLLRSVRHPAVIDYETTLRDKDGKLFLIMEYVDGKSLADYIRKGARLPAAEVLKLGLRLAGGLEAIHKLGIVHRDVAPDNILIPNDRIGDAKFIDFGLASDTVGTEASIIGDSFAGKLSYSAPEQLGLFGNKTTHKTDFYALGLVLMKVAGLPVPGEGKGFAAMEDRKQNVTIAGKGVTPALKSTLEAILKADPADRPDNLVALFRDALAEEQRQADAAKPKVGGTSVRGVDSEVSPKPGQGGGAKSKMPLIAAGIGAVVVVGALAFFFMGPGIDTRPEVAVEQAEIAREALQQADPLQASLDLLNSSDADNQNAGMGALIAATRDDGLDVEVRQRAFIALGELYDPNTFDSSRAVPTRANADAAKRFYQGAVDLGSTAAQTAIANLPE